MSSEATGLSPSRDALCAIFVTYHPDAELVLRVGAVAPQVGSILIVDNGSNVESRAVLELCRQRGAMLIENGANLGIARALNIGSEWAVGAGYGWALLLDQDTQVDAGLATLLWGIARAEQGVAVIGSRFRDTHGRPDATLPVGSQGSDWREVESVITSGTLLSLQAYRAIGPFRDEFFIDHVDTEFCFRARARGFRVLETRAALMSHTIGAPSAHRLLGRQQWTTNHSAERRYYIARNNTVMLREYGTSRGGSWRLKSVTRCLRLAKRIAFFENDKLAKLGAVCQGWWDGMRGNMGPRS